MTTYVPVFCPIAPWLRAGAALPPLDCCSVLRSLRPPSTGTGSDWSGPERPARRAVSCNRCPAARPRVEW